MYSSDDIIVRLVFSNAHCKSKKLKKERTLTKEDLYDNKLFIPPTDKKCFSGYLLKFHPYEELKEFAVLKEQPESGRYFIGFAINIVSDFENLGLSINIIEEHGFKYHVDICHDSEKVEFGKSISESFADNSNALESKCEFLFETPSKFKNP